MGLETHLWIRLSERREKGRFDNRQIATDRVSAVQFVRFPLGGLDPAEFKALTEHGKIEIEVDHPKLAVTVAITGDIAEALTEDLASE